MCPSWNRLNIQVPGLPQKCYSGLRNKEKTTIVVLGLFPSKVISIFMFVLLCCCVVLQEVENAPKSWCQSLQEVPTAGNRL